MIIVISKFGKRVFPKDVQAIKKDEPQRTLRAQRKEK